MPERDFMRPGRSVAMAETAMAATSHPQATLAALDILRAGGNAADAALAAVALQGVIDPHMTGIGGDCFALLASPSGAATCINGSGRAPRAADAAALRDCGIDAIDQHSADAVTVPGAVAAWCAMSERHGRLGLDRVLQPAIAAARDGFRITPRVAHDWARYADTVRRTDAARAQYLPGGAAPRPGERRDAPALAATLARIAKEGPAAFYEGEVAAEIVATLRAHGGVHDEGDFHAARCTETAPVSAAYRDRRLAECPPNGQGLAALLMARILDGFDMADPRLTELDRIHLFAEATKAAYRVRDAVLADPDTMTVTVDEILDEAHVAPLRAAISLERASAAASTDMPVHRDTVYVSVVDRDGNAASVINSIFAAFGSGLYAPRSGVLLQNRGSGFTLAEGHPNMLGPGKRPLNTIIPGMMTDAQGRPEMPFGVMGGQFQPTGQMQILSRLLDEGLDVQAASDCPRSLYENGSIGLEPTIAPAIARALEARGHATHWVDEPLGGAQAIRIDHERGVLWGASDHRKDGIALGY